MCDTDDRTQLDMRAVEPPPKPARERWAWEDMALVIVIALIVLAVVAGLLFLPIPDRGG